MKNIKWILATVTVSVFLSFGLLTAPSSTAAPAVDDQDLVWIYGELIQQDSGYCYSRSVKSIRLQARTQGGKWITLDRSTRKRSKDCKSKRFPFIHQYNFVLDELGIRKIKGSRARLLELREVTSEGNRYPFTKKVYASKGDHVRDLGDAFCEVLGLPPGC